MYKKTKIKRVNRFVFISVTLFFGAMFVFFISNHSSKLIGHSNIVSANSPDVRTFSLSGYEWTDTRASVTPCNNYCKGLGYSVGTVTGGGSKVCAGAQCSYISDFNLGTKSLTGNDGNCGCNDQFICACSVPIVELVNCTDSDGGLNIYIKGQVIDIGHPGTFSAYDKCLTDNSLLEYTCKNDAWYANYPSCPNGCIDGACVEEDAVPRPDLISKSIILWTGPQGPYETIYPEIGDHPGFMAESENIGTADLKETVRGIVYLDNEKLWEGNFASYLAQETSWKYQYTDYLKDLNLSEGKHSLRFIIDYDNKIVELDETNNEKVFTFDISHEESGEEKNAWDVAVRFDNAHKALFYPFSEIEGETGKTYYAELNKSDDLYEEYVGGECCEYWSNSYYYNKFEEEQAKRAKGWYAERIKISDSKYKLLIRGVAWADCSYEGYGYTKGELNINPSGDWKISEVVNCSVSGSNKGQETYCETGEDFVKFAAGSTCGGCCACADSAGINIEIIVEKNNNDQSNQIKVISPNGGETYEKGQVIKIKFLNSITNKTDIAIVYPGGPNYGMAWVTSEDKNVEQIIDWSVPKDILLGEYKIKISAIDKEYDKLIRSEDFSDNSFSIIDSNNNCLPDGTLIKLPNDPRIFVIKSCKKQWIETVEEFRDNGYDWSVVKETSPEVISVYADYFETTAKLLRAAGQNQVYRVVNGKVLWIPNISAFNAQGLKWDSVEEAPDKELEKYPKVKLIKAEGDDKIFYITDSGMKKHILTTEVFNSYNNKYSDVTEVDFEVMNSLETVNLMKDENGNKVYKIEGNKKIWIKDVEAFNRNKFDWSKVAPANDTELNAFEDAGVIE